jgi:hypothetical protein
MLKALFDSDPQFREAIIAHYPGRAIDTTAARACLVATCSDSVYSWSKPLAEETMKKVSRTWLYDASVVRALRRKTVNALARDSSRDPLKKTGVPFVWHPDDKEIESVLDEWSDSLASRLRGVPVRS